MNNSYSATRIQVMRSRLIKREEYERLLKMSEHELISFLQSTDYKQDVDTLALRDLDDLETVDRIMARNNERTYTKLQHISSREFKAALQAFLQQNDIWNLKVIAEAITGKADPKVMLQQYAKRGTFDPMQYASVHSIEELSKLAAKRVRQLHKHPTTLAAFMDALSYTKKTGSESDRYLIDEQNIMRLVMLKREKLPGEQIARRMQRGGTINHAILRDAANAATIQEAIRAFRTTKYAKVVERAITQDSLVRFEFELHHEILRRIKHLAGSYPLAPAVIVRYLIEKDMEVANLRLLIKGKHLGLDEQFLREQLEV